MSAATYGVPGAFDPQQPGNPSGGASTGIGLSCLGSGPDANNFSVDQANDVVLPYIGAGSDAAPSSTTNLGNIVVEPTTFVAGSGYSPDGRYRVQSAGGGRSAGTAEIELTVAGGAITWARVVRPGSNFTSAPTFNVATAVNFDTGATITGGTLGTVTVTIANLGTKPTSVGTPGNNKPFRRVLANAPAANGSAVPPSTYLNYSGRAMVAGDEVFAVAP
jgi:hypothetical protein